MSALLFHMETTFLESLLYRALTLLINTKFLQFQIVLQLHILVLFFITQNHVEVL